MKKLLTLAAAAALVIPPITSCSGSKSADSDSTSAEKTETSVASEEESAGLDFDQQGLKALMDKNKEELTEDDIDFLLDQAEILVNKTEGMTKEEFKEYKKSLSSDDMGTIMVIGMGCESARKSGIMTDSQKERLEKLEAQTPK